MTISALDSDLLFRGNEFMTTTALTSTNYFKEMNQVTTAPTSAINDSTNELELNFLSEFLLHEDFVQETTGTHDDVPNDNGPYPQEMKMEAMPMNTSATSDYYSGDRNTMTTLQPQFHYSAAQRLQTYQDNVPSHSYHAVGSPHSSTSSVSDTPKPLDRKAKRRQQVAISARRHRSRKKHELLDLRKEVSFMTSQLEFLRSKHKMMRPDGAVAEWEEKAMAQRRKRRQAESRNEELRRAIFTQSQFLGSLKSVFSNSPMFTEDLNMRQLLHTYTRLGCNPRSRQRDYEAICAQSKFQMATDILRRQTESIHFSTPYVKTQVIDTVDMFGATIVSVYAFDTLDMIRMFQAACTAIKNSGVTWPEFTDIEAQRKVVDAVPQSNIIYGKQTIRYKFDPVDDEVNKSSPPEVEPQEEIVVEARVISSWKVTQSEAVVVWDYVDDDDLHPLRPDYDIKRDMVGAMLVRRELCEDGKERVVCRSVCSKVHTRSTTIKSIMSRFSTSPARSLTRMCGNVVYQSIRAAVAQFSA